jgi:hypothetical protein
VSLTASTTVGLGAMALQSLDGGCMLYCVHMERELSGAVVASTASLVKGFASF